MKTSTSESPKSIKKLKRRSRKKRKTDGYDSDDKRDAQEVAEIKNRRGARRPARNQEEDELGPFLQRKEDLTYRVHQPGSYRATLKRIEERQSNRVQVPEGLLHQGLWTCALCQVGPLRENLGDLYGPYYLHLEKAAQWPPFLAKPKKSTKSSNSNNQTTNSPSTSKKSSRRSAAAAKTEADISVIESEHTDLWFHGDCLIWTPGLLVLGTKLVGANEQLPKAWKQKCSVCRHWGASIRCEHNTCAKTFHYACANNNGCSLQEDHLRAYCSEHVPNA